MNKTNKHKPMFSIIVPVYNAEKYLKTCLNSIINQTCKDFELILVNDGSTDKSKSICEEFIFEDSRLKLINITNSGPSNARSKGLTIAKGDYVVYVDSDDYIDKSMLTELSKIINMYTDIDAITFKYYSVEKSSKKKSNFEFLVHKKSIQPGYYDMNKIKKELYPYIFIIGNYMLMNTNTAYKRSVLLNTYCKNNKIIIGEDAAYAYEYY